MTRLAQAIIHRIGKLYLRLALGIRRVEAHDLSLLCDALSSHYSGASQVLLAFRHVDVADGPVVMHAVANLVRKRASSDFTPHCYFLYGRDVLNWAGSLARWIFPRSGGIAVSNTHQDRLAVGAIREVLRAARHPFAFAPEGQVTYRMGTVGPTMAGAGTFAWWCRQSSTGTSSKPVIIVPIALGYHYGHRENRVLRRTLSTIGRAIGSPAPAARSNRLEVAAWLLVQTAKAFEIIEEELVGSPVSLSVGQNRTTLAASNLKQKRDALCKELLLRGERVMGLRSEGPLLDRLFRLRHTALASIYRRDGDPSSFIPMRVISADLAANCGVLANRFQQIVDILMYLSPERLIENHSRLDLREYALNFLDLVNRVNSGNIDSRNVPRGRTAVVAFGTPFEAQGSQPTPSSRRKYAEDVNKETVVGLEAATEKLWKLLRPYASNKKGPTG